MFYKFIQRFKGLSAAISYLKVNKNDFKEGLITIKFTEMDQFLWLIFNPCAAKTIYSFKHFLH